MPRWSHPVLLVMLLAGCVGCATGVGLGRLADVSRVATRDEAVKTGKPHSRLTTVAPRHPSESLLKRKSRLENSGAGETPEPARAARSKSESECKVEPDRKSAESVLIAELIESELRDASPAERRELRRELSGLDAELVRQILRIRRRSLEAQDRAVAQSRSRAVKPIPNEARSNAAARGEPDAAAATSPGKHTPPRLGMPTLAGLGIANPFSLSRSKPAEGHTPPPAAEPDDAPGSNSGVVITAATDAAGSAVQRANFTAPATPRAESPNGNSEATPAAIDPASETQPTPATVPTSKSALENLLAIAEAEAQQLQLGASDVERQAYVDGHVHLRLLYLMAGRPQQALQAIPGLEPAEQEFWQQLFWGIAAALDSQTRSAPAERASHTISQLAAAIQRLQQLANVEITNATFCHKISSFGNYERIGQDEISPGQPVLIYAELSNFRSEVTPEGLSRTQLSSTIEIVKPGEKEEVIEQIPFPMTEDVCRNQRRDYFHGYEITLPQRLNTGPHVLRLTVEDQLSKKKATTTLNFVVK
jgi:hypothetical protein